MRLTDHIALVGSGDSGGFSLSHPLDCHVYLVDGGDELALVDAGNGLDVDAILAQVRQAGGDLARLRYLFLTHGHYDHSGGCRALREGLGLQVVASAATARWLSTGDEVGIGLAAARRAGLYPESARLEPCPVDVVVADGDVVAVGGLSVTALATPGHSADHTAYLLADDAPALFSGDSIFVGGKIIVQNLPDCVLSDYVMTIRRLAGLQIARLLPSHGLLALKRGQQHLLAAMAAIDRLQIPGNLAL
ncbi:MAG: MBL fold metallo-hydrolase [Anaerolineae bacterium]|nr:MBL fold metallo-hydrolase [Anaerolineae bacterium]